MFYELRSYKLE